MSDRKKNTIAPPADTADASDPLRVKYEARCVIYKKSGERVPPGSTVYADELEDAPGLLAASAIADINAPVPPSQAAGIAAFDRMLGVAIRRKLVQLRDGTYKFGEVEVVGLASFREVVTIEQLEDAIVDS